MHMKYHNVLSVENEYRRATIMEISNMNNSLKVNQSKLANTTYVAYFGLLLEVF